MSFRACKALGRSQVECNVLTISDKQICRDPKWVIKMLKFKKLVSKAIKLVMDDQIPLICAIALTRLNSSMQGHALKDPCIKDLYAFETKVRLHIKEKHHIWCDKLNLKEPLCKQILKIAVN
jgi:hypothetical protein